MAKGRRNKSNPAPVPPAATEKAAYPAIPEGWYGKPPALDSQVDRGIQFISLDEDPIDRYNDSQLTLIARRNMLLSLWYRCSAATRAIDSVAADIASSDLTFTPSQSNPDASTLVEMQKRMELVNNSMLRNNGHRDWVLNVCRNLPASKTGMFVIRPIDDLGDISAISLVQPQYARPYYGFGTNNEPIITPMASRVYATVNGTPPTVHGIWWTENEVFAPGRYFLAPTKDYVQLIWGSYGGGGFLDCIPPAELCMSEMATYVSISDHLRRTYNLTDDSQVITVDNGDVDALKKQLGQMREIREKMKRGERVDDKDKGLRLLMQSQDSDRAVKVGAVDLRAFPTDYKALETLAYLSQVICFHLGLNPHRASPNMTRDRTDSGTAASVMQSNEPGYRYLKSTFEDFFSGEILKGLPAKAMLRNATPDNHSRLAADLVASQVVSQWGDGLDPQIRLNYLMRTGTLTPADLAGVNKLPQLSDGGNNKAEAKAAYKALARQAGWSYLSWADGNPIMPNEIYGRMPVIITRKEVTQSAIDQIDRQAEECMTAALNRWVDWYTNELPTVVDQYGLNARELETEVGDIAEEIAQIIVRCAQRHVGRSKTPRLRLYYDTLRSGWLNRIAPLGERPATNFPPAYNMYNRMRDLARAFVEEKATERDLQNIAIAFSGDIKRYMTAGTSAYFQGQEFTGPVEWVVDPTVQNCADCLRFRGRYESVEAMLKVTRNRWPRDITLLCAGNCHCHIKETV